MPHTAAQPAPLAKAEYLAFRNRYVPASISTIFVLESPPASGKYFYNPEGKISEPLFRVMMKDLLEIEPTSKEEGLKEFAARGFLLIDATYTPVNRAKGKARDAIVLGDFPLLVADLREHAGPDTSIVLVKANVCTLFESKLQEAGFNVLNRGSVIPFPSSGQQNNFTAAIREVLGSVVVFQVLA